MSLNQLSPDMALAIAKTDCRLRCVSLISRSRGILSLYIGAESHRTHFVCRPDQRALELTEFSKADDEKHRMASFLTIHLARSLSIHLPK